MSSALQSAGDWLSKVAQPLLWVAGVAWLTISGVSSALSYLDETSARLVRLEQFQEAAGASIRSIDSLSENVARLDRGQDMLAAQMRELAQQTYKISGQIEGLTDQINSERRRR